MCDEEAPGLKDPPLLEERCAKNKLYHSSGVLPQRMKDLKRPGHTNHKHSGGQTKFNCERFAVPAGHSTGITAKPPTTKIITTNARKELMVFVCY